MLATRTTRRLKSRLADKGVPISLGSMKNISKRKMKQYFEPSSKETFHRGAMVALSFYARPQACQVVDTCLHLLLCVASLSNQADSMASIVSAQQTMSIEYSRALFWFFLTKIRRSQTAIMGVYHSDAAWLRLGSRRTTIKSAQVDSCCLG